MVTAIGDRELSIDLAQHGVMSASRANHRRFVSSPAGRYELIQRIAIGGMAEVFEARARVANDADRRVAVKRILPDHARNPAYLAMFVDEARLQGRLRHPNLAQVFDLGLDGQRPFYVMEYLDGLDGRHLRRALRERGRTMSLPDVLTIVRDIAAALHAAHQARGKGGAPLGVIHRDVTPANIMVTVDGAVKLLDFGIARHAEREIHTEAGVLKGKAAYMSPEQILCRPLDRRSDVFSLGIVLYELTTGSRLYDRPSDLATMRQVLLDEVPRPSERVPGYPLALERVVLRALARDPAARYPTADAMRMAIEEVARELRIALGGEGLARLMAELGGPAGVMRSIRAPEELAEGSGGDATSADALLAPTTETVGGRPAARLARASSRAARCRAPEPALDPRVVAPAPFDTILDGDLEELEGPPTDVETALDDPTQPSPGR